jgi:hypothetical protein
MVAHPGVLNENEWGKSELGVEAEGVESEGEG